jgi:dTMP kinase
MSVFITVDGPNGVGKTTLIHALANLLRASGNDVVVLRQPSDSDLGNFARNNEQRLTGMALAALVVADRYLQIDTAIKPNLAEGRIVLCDRYVASTLALQRLDGLPLDVLWDMNSQALVPDLSVLLIADPAIIEQRLDERGRKSRFERMDGIAAREVAYFKEAFELLRRVGYKTLEVVTTETSPESGATEIAIHIVALGGSDVAT